MLAVREPEKQVGLTSMAEEYLEDKKQERNIQREITELLRQSVYSRMVFSRIPQKIQKKQARMKILGN